MTTTHDWATSCCRAKATATVYIKPTRKPLFFLDVQISSQEVMFCEKSSYGACNGLSLLEAAVDIVMYVFL